MELADQLADQAVKKRGRSYSNQGKIVDVAAARLAIDVYKWVAKNDNPEHYGAKPQKVEVSGTIDGKVDLGLHLNDQFTPLLDDEKALGEIINITPIQKEADNEQQSVSDPKRQE